MSTLLAAAGSVFRLFTGKSKKFMARVLDAAALESALVKIDALEKAVKEKDTLIERQGFPYELQFTPKNLSQWFQSDEGKRPAIANPKSAHPMFGESRIPSGKAWEYDPKITQFDFSDWFELERFRDIHGLPEVVTRWREILGSDIACWKGAEELEVVPESHPYLRHMYPFVWVARIPKERVKAQTEHIRALVRLFLDWCEKLSGPHLKTSLSINRIIVLGSKQAYIVFRYDFHDIKLAGSRRKPKAQSYSLFRQVILAASGGHVYFVSAGEPRENPHNPTEYAGHIDEWLNAFQLGSEE